MAHPHRRAAAVIVFIAVVATGVAHASTSDDPMPPEATTPSTVPEWEPSDNEEFEESDLNAISERDGVSRADAERRMRVENAAVSVQRVARGRWPQTFAGLWIQPAGEPLVFAAFTERAEEKVAELRLDFPYPDILRSATAAVPLASLHTIQNRMIRERSDLQQGRPPASMGQEIRATRGVYDIGIDEQQNRIHVSVASASASQERSFRDRYTDRLIVTDGVAQPACSRANCYPSMRGGLSITSSNANFGFCTSGFSAVASTGNLYVLGAGHCGGVGSTWSNGGTTYGSVSRSQVQDNVDAMRVPRGSAWTNRGVVWHSSTDQRSMESWISWDNIVSGTNLAMSGQTSGTTLGTVDRKDISLSYVPNSTRFVSARFCSAGGDSGGSVYRDNTAYGILSGNTSGISCGSASFRSFFGPIEYALTAMNVGLLAGSSGDQPVTTTTTTQPVTTTTTQPATTTTSRPCTLRNPVNGACLYRA